MATTTKDKKAQSAPKTAEKKEVAVDAAVLHLATTRSALERRKEIVGTVVSDKMQKTIVVKVDRRVRHAAYKKYITRSSRYKAHDETNSAKIGDLVTLIESRPLSKDKRWVLKTIVRRAGLAPEANV